jgi:hypothetical protein
MEVNGLTVMTGVMMVSASAQGQVPQFEPTVQPGPLRSHQCEVQIGTRNIFRAWKSRVSKS